MTIPLVSGDAREKHGYVNTTVQIPGCFIAEENYFQSRTIHDWVVSDAEQFPIIIRQFMEIFRCDRPKIFNWLGAQAAISPENAQLDQNIRPQPMQSDNLIADHWQLTLDEVFHVHS